MAEIRLKLWPGACRAASSSQPCQRRHQCVNWHAAGFSDPFPVRLVTLDNPAYRIWGISLMEAKLDWVLLRRLRAQATAVGNKVSRVRG